MESPSITSPQNEQPPPPGVQSHTEYIDNTVTLSIPKSILGAEQAKKRLQAFCIQKKQKLEPELKVLNKISSKKSDTKKTNTSSQDNDKSKPGSSKKSSKMNEYERSKMILSNMMEFKEEEERKLALIRLGVPLGLVPGGVIGLKQQSMPTKAMPPIQKLLNPKDVERIISQAAKGDGDIDFKVSINELTKPAGKNDKTRHSNDSRSHSRNDRDRRNNRHLDRHQRYDHKRDRNDRDRRHNRNDSHSSRYRDYNRSKERKKSDSKDSKDTGGKSGVKYLDLGKKSRVGEYVIASLFGSGNVNQMNPIKKEEKKVAIKTFDEFEITAKGELDIEGADALKAQDEENVFETENDTSTPAEVVKETEIVQDSNKFIRNSFVPIFAFEETSVKSCSDEDINDFNLDDCLIETEPKSTVSDNLTVIDSEFMDLYSPNVESSINGDDDEGSKTPILNEIPIVEKNVQEPVPDLVCDMEENFEFCAEPEIENKNVTVDVKEASSLWTDISQICNPNMHFSSECYRQTFNQPIINYCKNLNFCNCRETKRKNMEKLSNNVDKIKNQLLDSDIYDPEILSSKGWYPKTTEVFNTYSVDSLSNWESDDSDMHEVPKNTKSNVNNLQKIMEDKFELKDTPNNECDSFSKFRKFTLEDTPKMDTDELPKYMSKKFTLEDSPKVDTDKLPIFPKKFLLEDTDNLPKIEANEFVLNDKPKLDAADQKHCVKIDLPFNIPNNHVQSPIKNVSNVTSLDSEYEKFMEAVWPEISENKMDQEDQDRSQESFAESQVSKTISEMSDDHLTKSNTVQMEDDDFNMIETSKSELISNESNVNKDVAQNISKLNEEHWSGDSNMDDGKKSKKQIYISPKPEQKRKGHAKISSRRKKGKHKKKSKIKGESGSSSSDDSKGESSSSSSTDSSSDDSSHSSKSSSSSSSDLSSFSDLLSSDVSLDESDSSKGKKKKKKQLKKKYRKLSKSKQKKLRLIAKAKELAKKMKLKKKKKKLKAKLAKEKSEKKTNPEVYDEKEDNPENSINKSLDVKKKKRKLSDDGKISKKNKKKKYSDSNESSDSSSNSSDSQSIKEKTNKRKIKCDDETIDSDKAKRMKFESSDLDKPEESLDLDTLNNIKREKVSDEEDLQQKNVQIGKVTRAPFRQQIINASELQSDFLSVNKYQETVSEPLKTESPTHVNFSDMFNKCASESNQFSSLYDDEDLDGVEKKSLDDEICEFSNNSNGHTEQSNEEIENIPFADEEETLRPIEKIECHWRPEPSKSIADRKASRWDTTIKESLVLSHINNSALIEVPIQTEIETYNDTQVVAESDNFVYKIPTISSRSDDQTELLNYGDIESYNDYDVYSKHDEIEQETFKEVNTTPSRKISLDDRINMVLQFPGDTLNSSIDRNNSSAKNPKMDITPDKGILVGGVKVARSDPRINRAKRVSFADGFIPGQDSDCENDINVVQQMNTSISTNGTLKKKKKHKASGGHAYPCPDSWPDYHPKWDKLPPPPPPSGSPPPDLCEKTNSVPHFSISINTAPLQTLLPNLVENLLVS